MLERRSFLSGLASLPLIGGGTATIASPSSPDLGGLWHKFQLARGAERQASEKLTAAEERLPWWAKAGPKFVDRHGAFSEPVVGWPALETYTLPEHDGAYRLIRIGPSDIAKRYEGRLWFASKARAQELRDQDQAAFEARLAKRDAMMKALGIPDLHATHDAACDARMALQDAIEALPDGRLDVLAMKILLQLHREAPVEATADEDAFVALAATALRGLLPHLDGELALDVADAIADPLRPVQEMRISRGVLPDFSA